MNVRLQTVFDPLAILLENVLRQGEMAVAGGISAR